MENGAHQSLRQRVCDGVHYCRLYDAALHGHAENGFGSACQAFTFGCLKVWRKCTCY